MFHKHKNNAIIKYEISEILTRTLFRWDCKRMSYDNILKRECCIPKIELSVLTDVLVGTYF